MYRKPYKSPDLTPIKPLPFSPSQFLNSPTMNLNFDVNLLASTPVHKMESIKNGSMLSTPILEKIMEKGKDSNLFGVDIVPIHESKSERNVDQGTKFNRQTPMPDKIRRSADLPRTPTPFKKALAALGRRRSGLYVPPSPARLAQDITEIMQNDQLENNNKNLSDTKSYHQKRNSHVSHSENLTKQQQQKQFENSWESSDMSYLAETPSKTLISESSGILFSPIIREAFSGSDILLDSGSTKIKDSPNQLVLDPKWEKLACGKTKDQLYMLQQAQICLKKTNLQPRSLNFYK